MKHMSLNDENNRIYAKYAKQRRREERIICLIGWCWIAVIILAAIGVFLPAACMILEK